MTTDRGDAQPFVEGEKSCRDQIIFSNSSVLRPHPADCGAVGHADHPQEPRTGPSPIPHKMEDAVERVFRITAWIP